MSKGFSVKTAVRTLSILAAATGFCGLTATAAQAAETPVALGISGWTGFAPLLGGLAQDGAVCHARH